MDLLDIKEFISDFFGYIVVVISVIVVIVYIATLQIVFGESMSPVLEGGDIVIQNKISYSFNPIKRLDIVSVQFNNTNLLVKRVIGLPGERIRIIDNKLYINHNGEETVLEETYIKDYTENFDLKSLNYEEIPEDMYLILGDNRNNSTDSRELGLIHKNYIVGKVDLRIWPLNKIGFIE